MGLLVYKQVIKRQANAAPSVFRLNCCTTLPILLIFANIGRETVLTIAWKGLVLRPAVPFQPIELPTESALPELAKVPPKLTV
jgi:hypothetical protein